MREIDNKNRQNNTELSDDDDPDYYNYNKNDRYVEQKNTNKYRDYKGSRQDTQNTHEDDEYIIPENKNLMKKNSQINSNKIPSYGEYRKNDYNKQPDRELNRRNTNNNPNLPNSNNNMNMNKNRGSNLQNSYNMPYDKVNSNQGGLRNNNTNEKGQSNVVKSVSLLLEDLNFNDLLYIKEKVDMKLFAIGNNKPNKQINRNNNYNSNDYYEDDY
jgi:hypothetical protein